MRFPSWITLSVLILFSALSLTQLTAQNLLETAPEDQSRESRHTPVPVIGNSSNQILSLTLEGGAYVPVATASRIFAETVHGFTREVNASRPVAVHLKLLVKVGADSNDLEQVFGAKYDAVIRLTEWNENVFSRLLVRAVRGAILTEDQLDDIARAALSRAHARVDVSELKH